jgi:hypothetical protein
MKELQALLIIKITEELAKPQKDVQLLAVLNSMLGTVSCKL